MRRCDLGCLGISLRLRIHIANVCQFFFWNDFSISKGFATQVLSRLEERMVKHRDCLDAVEASELPVVVRVTFSESVNIAPLFYSSKKFRLVL